MAANPATYVDVADRWPGHTLSSAEQSYATLLLADGWRMLKREVGDLNARLDAAEPDLSAEVVAVLAEAVKRVLQNPEGFRQQSITVDDGTVSRTIDRARSEGLLGFTDAELDRLRLPAVKQGVAFSIMPASVNPFACDEFEAES